MIEIDVGKIWIKLPYLSRAELKKLKRLIEKELKRRENRDGDSTS